MLGVVAVAGAETVADVRQPCARGCVVEYEPYDWSRPEWSHPADAVESALLIGNLDGVARMAVLEYDLRSLPPGVIDAARITGRIDPYDLEPSGSRNDYLRVDIGNGAVDVGDAVYAYKVDKFSPPIGTGGTYDYDITQQMREMMVSDPDYLRALIQPDTDEQGWDIVSAAGPAPRLELQVRPRTASTLVYRRAPVAAGAAFEDHNTPLYVEESATKADVMKHSAPGGATGLALMEYDLRSIPAGATVLWAKLDVYIPSVLVDDYGTVGPEPFMKLYAGDGWVSVADAYVPTTPSLLTPPLLDDGVYPWDLSRSIIQSFLNTGATHLGVRVQAGLNPALTATLLLDSDTRPGLRPYLVIAYEVPGSYRPGDADRDGDVDLDDFVILKRQFGITGAVWADGDFDGDGEVELDDFVILKQNFGAAAAQD